MHSLIVALICLILAVVGVILRKTYFYLPAHELKRRAEQHDPDATVLYKAVAYGSSLRVLLWLYIGLASAAAVVLLSRQVPVWAALLIVGPILWVVFSLLPATRTSRFSIGLTKLATPAIAGLLRYLQPVLEFSSNRVEPRYQRQHTGLFERGDLVDLIDRQKGQDDSRLSAEELEIVKRALTFDEITMSQVLTPRKKVKTVLATDTVGPILIDELHKTKDGFVLVKESKKGPVVGSLAFKDVGLNSSGQVNDVMDKNVCYLNEEDNLSEAFRAYFSSGQSVFVIVNNFEEFVGIASIDAVLKQLVGDLAANFDYTDRAAAANRFEEAKDEEESETIQSPDNTEAEVVE